MNLVDISNVYELQALLIIKLEYKT